MGKASRHIRRVSDTHWIVTCSVCPRRQGGSAQHKTEEDCNAWWLWHRATPEHKFRMSAEGVARVEAQEQLLAAIFGKKE